MSLLQPQSALGSYVKASLISRLKRQTVALYDLPVEFWRRVLDEEMHFHLGHFPNSSTTFEESMALAVQRLASGLPFTKSSRCRVLDIGCGWGGPAFQLNRLWTADVLGITVSQVQTDYVNSRTKLSGASVAAKTLDSDDFDFQGIGTFDLIWMYDSLDHMANRGRLFEKLHNASSGETQLAIATHCRSSDSAMELFSEFMGIQPIVTMGRIEAMLEGTGWEVFKLEDCTYLTAPVWRYWINNLASLGNFPEAERFSRALSQTEDLYSKGMLQSIQLLARVK